MAKRKSFVSGSFIATLACPTLAAIATRLSGWPWWATVGAALLGFVIVLVGLNIESLGKRFGGPFERFLSHEHDHKTKSRCLLAIGLLFVASLLTIIYDSKHQGQIWAWAWPALFIALGTAVFYWGTKVCPAKNSKRAIAAIDAGGFCMSLAANFIVAAMTADVTIASTLAAVEKNTTTILAIVTRTETKVDKGFADSKSRDEALAKKIDDFIAAQKQPGVDPTTQIIPDDVLAAAHELIKSTDARQRTQAAIVLRDWATAKQEIDRLNLSRATDEVFLNKTLEGNFYYAQGNFDAAIPPFEVAFRLRESDFVARNNLAITLTQARLGNLSAQKLSAIEIYTGSLALANLSRPNWAMTQNNLGSAWLFMPTGDPTANLTKAIACYEDALKERTRAAAPMQWAATQNNLGTAWGTMPTGDRAANLTKAIACYKDALKERTRAAAPMQWATTQNNLGNAWLFMPTGDRAANLTKAIACYEQALEVRTRAAAPMDWAATQNNLGSAWSIMPTGDRAANLTKAIACYEDALKERTRAAAPMDWAGTQNNLGNAWGDMPTGDRAANLTKAIACYEDALKEYTRAAAPMEWATTQNNLGIAWRTMPTGDRAANLTKAIACYEDALKEFTRAAAPMQWAATQNNLGLAWGDMPTGDRAANLTKAIACYKDALKERTRAAAPMDWAMTHYNLALAHLAEQPNQAACALLRRSITSSKAALLVYTPEAFPSEHADTTNNLAIIRDRYEQKNCHTGPNAVPFDAIPPAD